MSDVQDREVNSCELCDSEKHATASCPYSWSPTPLLTRLMEEVFG